jgi:Ca-activated chloride channel homolog
MLFRALKTSFILFLLSVVLYPMQAQAVVVPPVGVNTQWVSVDYHRVNVEINQQIATTTVEMQFTNNGEALAEGQFIFPLPRGAAVQNLIMYIDGQAIEAKILPADEARAIYDEIVRQLRDPALLEYIGRDLLQANVFPIPAGDFRQIEITYGQALELNNGLIEYEYPLKSSFNPTVGSMSIRVSVTEDEAIGNVYSPTHRVALSRPNNTSFVAGFEQNNFIADNDYKLFYGLQRDTFETNVLSYRASANEDGFFMVMIQPPYAISEADIEPKDVVIVLDQSGSMDGVKWEQAQAATIYVLENLNAQDRFNVIPFSTGSRLYANELQPASNSAEAVEWVRSLYPEGGTNIQDALANALRLADSERSLSIIFLTDGLATEGIVDTQEILTSLTTNAPSNARIFSFGVGDDVDTFLLDSIVRDFRGTGSYVRPSERIDEEVASLYNKISSPVLTDISINFDGVTAELLYPTILPNLFAGEQLTLVGRYRNVGTSPSITLTGKARGETQTYTYQNITFTDNAGGEDFIARLWATRRIGDLLNSIRLNGETPELVDSIVSLSLRYGIITPYTSFLITEDDILSQRGLEEAQASFAAPSAETTGGVAVDMADMAGSMANSNAPAPVPTFAPAQAQESEVLGGQAGEMQPQNPIQIVGAKTFLWQDGVWTDTTFSPDSMQPIEVVFLSDAYFDLLTQFPDAAPYFAVGEQVIVVIDGTAYKVIGE